MAADNRAHLVAATQRRCAAARDRARTALRRLDNEGNPITFAAVATAAHVSRTLLYRDNDLRHEIERLRDVSHPTPQQRPAAQRATEASLNRRIEALLDDVRRLRAENHQLRDRLEGLLGEQRANRTAARASPSTIGSCS